MRATMKPMLLRHASGDRGSGADLIDEREATVAESEVDSDAVSWKTPVM
jgi:hypothetical protein